jgi:hypothetical protein
MVYQEQQKTFTFAVSSFNVTAAVFGFEMNGYCWLKIKKKSDWATANTT